MNNTKSKVKKKDKDPRLPPQQNIHARLRIRKVFWPHTVH